MIVASLMAARVGTSFTEFTVTVKVRVIVLLAGCPSFTVTEMVAEPFALAVGVKVRLPVVPGLA